MKTLLLNYYNLAFLQKKLVRDLATNKYQVDTTIILPKHEVVMVLKDSFQKWTDLDIWTEFQRLPYKILIETYRVFIIRIV